MILPPIEPGPGDRVSATWMRKFVRYVRSIAPIAGPGLKSSVTPNGTILRADIPLRREAPHSRTPHAYEVRPYMDGSSGYQSVLSWKIYLPTAHLLYWADGETPVESRYMDVRKGMDSRGDGWYDVPVAFGNDASKDVWLRLYRSGGVRKADVGTAPYGGAHDIHVATLLKETRTVEQSVVGAVAITDPCRCEHEGSGSGGGSWGGPSGTESDGGRGRFDL